jgi:hypothetical protein
MLFDSDWSVDDQSECVLDQPAANPVRSRSHDHTHMVLLGVERQAHLTASSTRILPRLLHDTSVHSRVVGALDHKYGAERLGGAVALALRGLTELGQQC